MSSPYQLSLHPEAEFSRLIDDPKVFAIVRHGERTGVTVGDVLLVDVGLRPLAEPVLEVWRSGESLTRGRFEAIEYVHSDTFFFGVIKLDEGQDASLSEMTRQAYQSIHNVLEETGFPALTRMWNFFPRINEEQDGLERYRSFCLGRHDALDEWYFTESLLPAASALGSHAEGLVIYFFAARQAGKQVENPRQVSAFHYPKQYGPKSPSFSRALYKSWGKSQHLYISGTASIVGHKSVHVGDPMAQLDETLRNVRVVIEQAQSQFGVRCQGLHDLNNLRVYIRHPEHAEMIMQRLQVVLGDAYQNLVVVWGDICREELLLEIEGHYLE